MFYISSSLHQRQKAEEEKAKKAEIDALQAQLAQLKEMNKGNIVSTDKEKKE